MPDTMPATASGNASHAAPEAVSVPTAAPAPATACDTTSAPEPHGRGYFITLEGIDGCGKSTQAHKLVDFLRARGQNPLLVREPGGTNISESIRALLLDPANKEMTPVCELLLLEAARAQLVDELIRPALEGGRIVICDRFYDSTFAYQYKARGLDKTLVCAANDLGRRALVPDLTLFFRIDPQQTKARLSRRARDRMEREGTAFQQRVAQGYEELCAEAPARVAAIDAAQPIEQVFNDVISACRAHIPEMGERTFS